MLFKAFCLFLSIFGIRRYIDFIYRKDYNISIIFILFFTGSSDQQIGRVAINNQWIIFSGQSGICSTYIHGNLKTIVFKSQKVSRMYNFIFFCDVESKASTAHATNYFKKGVRTIYTFLIFSARKKSCCGER